MAHCNTCTYLNIKLGICRNAEGPRKPAPPPGGADGQASQRLSPSDPVQRWGAGARSTGAVWGETDGPARRPGRREGQAESRGAAMGIAELGQPLPREGRGRGAPTRPGQGLCWTRHALFLTWGGEPCAWREGSGSRCRHCPRPPQAACSASPEVRAEVSLSGKGAGGQPGGRSWSPGAQSSQRPTGRPPAGSPPSPPLPCLLQGGTHCSGGRRTP